MARGNELAGERGFQDGITPRYQPVRGILSWLLFIGCIAYGFWINTYVAVVCLFALPACSYLAGLFLPDTIEFYVRHLLFVMNNRTADYAKSGDVMRAKASENIDSMLAEVLLEVAGTGEKIPSTPTALAERDSNK
jgi:hypothetical protein